MSETDSGREGVWLETYRPQTLDEVVGQEAIVERLRHYVDSDDVPNMLFAGPAGVGKCVAGETPVLTDDGLARIEAVVGDIDGFADATDTRVLTLTGSGGFEYTAPSQRFARDAETRLAVSTRDGADATVTPEHRFLVREDGGFGWRRATDLEPGDRLVRPLSAPLPPTETALDPLAAMDGDRTLVHVPRAFAERHDLPAEPAVSAEPGVSAETTPASAAGPGPGGAVSGTGGAVSEVGGAATRAGTGVRESERGHTAVPLAALRTADIPRETVRTHVRGFGYVAPEDGGSGVVSLPWEVTPQLAEFLGLLVGGGRVERGRVTFDGAAVLSDRFDRLLGDLFGVDPARDEQRVTVDNATVTHFLTACFDLFERDGAIGSRLLRADAESRRAFLRAAFDAGATVTADGAELTLDGALATLCSYLLAGFGIPSGREETRADEDRLSLPGTHLDRFRSEVGFALPEKRSRLADATDWAEGHDEVLPEEHLYLDAVTGVEAVGAGRVYDLTVPGTRNYVAGRVPTVMHNTTSAIAVARELYGEDWEEQFMELNASDERGIDVIRDRVKSFARTSFGGANYRIIFLDESDALCVPPGTEVVAGYPSSPEIKPIEDIDTGGEPMPSVDFETNEIQSDKGRLVDSGVADFFEVELEDGRTVVASLGHPFFIVGDNGELVEKELRELKPGDEIAEFKDDIGVSRCEICGTWTAGRFCSLSCKNEGHSREMQGENNPMYGTEWSAERRSKIVEALSDGRLAGEDNPNYGGDFHGTPIWEMDEEKIDQFRETLSEMRAGTTWEEWVVDADPEQVKQRIGDASSEWWDSLDDERRAKLIEKSTRNCDYPVCDISGDNNPMRDPEVAQKVSEALQGHEPTGGGNIRYSDELGHIVRSDWEYEVAKALQEASVDYEYEPEFELSDSTLHPDFLIDDTVIEVKGDAKRWGQTEKVEEFLEKYGDEYRFVVVGDGRLPHHEHYNRDEFEPALVLDGGRKKVQTAKIDRIEYSHRGKAYNISMDGTPNFMLANGILTHNTSDAQAALRRTMEQFSNNVRFILSCNYSSQIIDPIQSRCAVFRFSPLGDAAIEQQVRHIATQEGIELTDDGVAALVYVAGGDMRAAINGLQAAAVADGPVDEAAVFEITSTARPEDIEAMVTRALDGDFTAARSQLDRLLTEEGIAGGDIVDQLHRSVWEFDLDDEAAVRLLDRIGEADYRITEGANERIQLEALLASVALDATDQ